MKGLNKLMATALSVLTFVGCSFGFGCTGGTTNGGNSGGNTDVVVEDTTKTQLKVKYNNGGLGRTWLDTVLAKFEELYADVEFEPGKKGVQIQKDFSKRNIELSAMKNSDAQVFLLEDLDIYDFGVKGTLLDITDLVKSPAKTSYTTSETATIESKMNDTHKAVYNVPTASHPEGGYYAIPFFDTSMNLNYNVETFENKHLYFKKDATADDFTEADFGDTAKVMALFVTDNEEARSYGPNGKTGVIDGVDYSYDDGLPATYADFRALLVQMELVGVKAFAWNDIQPEYLTSLINGVWANNVGADQMKLSLTFSGEAKNIVDLGSDGKLQYNTDGSIKVKNVTINESNADQIHLQKGKLDALYFAEMIASKQSDGESRYDEDSLTQSHLDAQNSFVNPDRYNQGEEIGFLVDGEWWLREASDQNFTTVDAMHNAKFAILPLPRATRAEVGTPTTNVCDHYSSIFINNNISTNYPERLEAAKELVSFLQNESSLLTFTYYTNMFRSLNYEISDSRLDELGYFSTDSKHEFGYFTKNVYATRIAMPDSEIIPWQPTSDITRTKASLLAYRKWGFTAMINGKEQSNPVLAFDYFDGELDPVDYFLKIYEYRKGNV